ncbi:2279_t:CDS:1 [Funneliformis geosporum]|uniref:7788_t:CDS:1 n=1 Tax=Funneliformis geosporum TaxID=1117311 RepID=A0A9W4STP3_9GLOM|nr:2279_t:CDS:1 [Funneliformis geosporum]CAI2180528.1 7788_t:CDS:1 [Funneliformis geosporum]
MSEGRLTSTVSFVKDISSLTYEKASRAIQTSHGIYDQLYRHGQQAGDRAYQMTKYYWINFPPLRWLAYTFVVFILPPAIVFVGWMVLSFGFVSAIAGTGVILSQGFLTTCGLFVFLPTASFLTIVAFMVACFAVFTWGGIQTVNATLSKFGLIRRGNFMEFSKQSAISGRGARQSDYNHSR